MVKQRAPSYFSAEDKKHFRQKSEVDAILADPNHKDRQPGKIFFCREDTSRKARKNIKAYYVLADGSVETFTYNKTDNPAFHQDKLFVDIATRGKTFTDFVKNQMLANRLKSVTDISPLEFKSDTGGFVRESDTFRYHVRWSNSQPGSIAIDYLNRSGGINEHTKRGYTVSTRHDLKQALEAIHGRHGLATSNSRHDALYTPNDTPSKAAEAKPQTTTNSDGIVYSALPNDPKNSVYAPATHRYDLDNRSASPNYAALPNEAKLGHYLRNYNFQGNATRATAESELAGSEPGTYLTRPSSEKSVAFVISGVIRDEKNNTKITHIGFAKGDGSKERPDTNEFYSTKKNDSRDPTTFPTFTECVRRIKSEASPSPTPAHTPPRPGGGGKSA